MKKFISIAAAFVCILAASCNSHHFETVKGDPLGTKIYTLDNGLQVYMSVNKETPRIQTYIAVKVGAKNDPLEALVQQMSRTEHAAPGSSVDPMVQRMEYAIRRAQEDGTLPATDGGPEA